MKKFPDMKRLQCLFCWKEFYAITFQWDRYNGVEREIEQLQAKIDEQRERKEDEEHSYYVQTQD